MPYPTKTRRVVIGAYLKAWGVVEIVALPCWTGWQLQRAQVCVPASASSDNSDNNTLQPCILNIVEIPLKVK